MLKSTSLLISQYLITNFLYCLPYNSYIINLDNLVFLIINL